MTKLTFLNFVIYLLVFETSYSQETQKVRKVVEIMPEQSFYLNGGFRSNFGGKSRSTYMITLPENTVEWYYIFTTTESDKSSSQNLNLVSQLTGLLDPTGMTSIIASSILSPSGANVCDIYLMDRNNSNAFINKDDNNGGQFKYYISGSRENYRNGTVQVKDLTRGTYYLGFKNPSSTSGIGVKFEAAAIVEEVRQNESSVSQTMVNQKSNDNSSYLSNGDGSAHYPGGESAWNEYLKQNLNFNIPINNGAPRGRYRVEIKFLIDKEGAIKNIFCEQDPGYGICEEVKRVLRNSRRWIPARKGRELSFEYRKQSLIFSVE